MRTKKGSVFLRLVAYCGAAAALVSLPVPASGSHRLPVELGPQRPQVVGRLESVSIGTEHPYRAQRIGAAWTRTVNDPGATYIRIHFAHFQLAEGDRLEIAGADGRERHVYTDRGPVGTGEFWAFTVPGDTAVLRLFAPTGGADGFEIDAYGRGLVPVLAVEDDDGVGTSLDLRVSASSTAGLAEPGGGPIEPDPTGLICGEPDWNDIACYWYDHAVDSRNARGAVLAIQGCCTATTAFKVSDSDQFMSAYRASVSDVELHLDYQTTECGGRATTSSGVVRGGVVLRSDPVLDYTLFTTEGDASAIPCLQLDRRQPQIGERVYIPEHPWGGPKKIALLSDLNLGVCRVDPLSVLNTLIPQTSEIGFLCDTAEGSLGAPVVSGATQRVVGISHRGSCPNAATRMDLIWPQIASLAGSCSNGFACQPVSGSRCDCNGYCSNKERNYIERGGTCSDCWEEPGP